MAEQQKKIPRKANIYMQETSPKNPFGPNYELLDRQTKIAYKYNMLMPYVQLSEEDAVYKLNEQLKLTGTLFAGLLGGTLIGILTRKMSKSVSINLYDTLTRYKRPYYALWIAALTTQAYMYATDVYNKKVCNYMLEKYLQQGIKNGFVDYRISGQLEEPSSSPFPPS